DGHAGRGPVVNERGRPSLAEEVEGEGQTGALGRRIELVDAGVDGALVGAVHAGEGDGVPPGQRKGPAQGLVADGELELVLAPYAVPAALDGVAADAERGLNPLLLALKIHVHAEPIALHGLDLLPDGVILDGGRARGRLGRPGFRRRGTLPVGAIVPGVWGR